jgi:hypothetical protein
LLLNNLGVFIVFFFFVGENYILKTASFQWEKPFQAVGSYVLHCNGIVWSRVLCFIQRERERQGERGGERGEERWKRKTVTDSVVSARNDFMAMHTVQDKSVRERSECLNGS